MTIIMPGRPITRRERITLSAMVVLVALILGFAGGSMLYQFNDESIKSSERIGRLLCGPGQFVDEKPVPPRSTRLLCRDAKGRETTGRNNLVAVYFALPFILVIAAFGLWLVWTGKIRMTDRRWLRRR